MPVRPDAPERDCEYCERPLSPKHGERRSKFVQRRFCNTRCATRFQFNGFKPNPNDPWLVESRPMLPPPTFPGAAFATLDETPTQCPRCAAPLYPEPTGFGCRLCGRHVYITELLQQVTGQHGFGYTTTRPDRVTFPG